jgi:hypothetical protein
MLLIASRGKKPSRSASEIGDEDDELKGAHPTPINESGQM